LKVGGTIVLYDRKVVRNFRKDGHNWKKKKDGKTVQEAHEKLKVNTQIPEIAWLCAITF
jgi:calmodulin-binding transcription activator